jgi:outer membrane protein W
MRRQLDRHLSKMVVAIACLAMAAQTAIAQKGGSPLFNVGYTDIGPTVGVGNLAGASASFGGRFEHAIKTLPDLGNGVLGIQVAAEYYSWSSNFRSGTAVFSSSIKYIPIGVTANYHFKLEEPKFDPFVGLGLGYNLVSCSYSGTFTGSGDCGYSSGIYFIGRAGARYFFSPSMAAYGDVGAGGATLNLGLMFKLR